MKTIESDARKDTPEPVPDPPTRAQLQARIGADYVSGKLTLAQWRRGSEHLSDCDQDGHPYCPRSGWEDREP